MSQIEVKKIIKAINASDGAGVKLKRSIGTPALLSELVKGNNLDNLFDDLFSVEEVKIYKPDFKVYDLPIKKYHIKPVEVTFLSANTWDVSGGGNYGYNAIWVNRNKSKFDNLDYEPN